MVSLADRTQREMRRLDRDRHPPVRRGEAAAWFEDALHRSWPRGTFVLVAELDGQPGGFVVAGPTDEPWSRGAAGRAARRTAAEIRELHVAPRFRRRGLGRTLLRAAEDRLAAEGFGEVVLGHLAGNDGAAALYEEQGFRPRWVLRVKSVRRHA